MYLLVLIYTHPPSLLPLKPWPYLSPPSVSATSPSPQHQQYCLTSPLIFMTPHLIIFGSIVTVFLRSCCTAGPASKQRICRFTHSVSFVPNMWVLVACLNSMRRAQSLIVYYWNIIYSSIRHVLLCAPVIGTALLFVQLSLHPSYARQVSSETNWSNHGQLSPTNIVIV